MARSEFRAHGRNKGQDRLQAMGFAWTCAARMLIASGALIQGLVFGGRRAGARESKRRGIGCVKGELVVFADLCARFWATMHASVALSERNTGPGHVCYNPRPLGSEGPTLRRSHTALHDMARRNLRPRGEYLDSVARSELRAHGRSLLLSLSVTRALGMYATTLDHWGAKVPPSDVLIQLCTPSMAGLGHLGMCFRLMGMLAGMLRTPSSTSICELPEFMFYYLHQCCELCFVYVLCGSDYNHL